MPLYDGQGFKMPMWCHIAIGVFLGLVLAEYATMRFWQYELGVEAEAVQAHIEKSWADQAAKSRAAATQRAADEAARVSASVEAQRADEARRSAAVAEKQRREQAWARYYQKPAKCEAVWDGDCANDYIRAKKKFDELYDAGTL